MSTPTALSMSNWQPSELPEPKAKTKRSMVGVGVGTFYAGAALYGGGWLQALRAKDDEIRRDAVALRSNSRRLVNNNPYMKRYVRAIGGHVVGPAGFTLQSQFGTKRGDRRDPWAGKNESGFALWGQKGSCTVCGRFSWLEVQRLFMRSMAMDGECFIRIVRGFPNDYGFALQFLDADLLDATYNVVGAGGNAIIMGVEVDAYSRPVAYHFTDPVSARTSYPRGQRIRIPAADIIHGFDPERSTQTRGVPWAANVMYLLSMLGHYWEAEVAAARHEAERPGFIKSPGGGLEEDDEDRENFTPATMDPLEAARRMPSNTGIAYMGIPAGLEIDIPDVKHPTTAFGEFSKAMLKGIASGLGISYAALSSDLTQVSYSSIRTGTLEDREYYRELQSLAIETLCRRVYNEWLFMAVLTGALKMPPGATFQAFAEHTWEPRGWDWVDPKNDTMAKIAAVDACLDTRTRILAERGLNFTDVVAELAKEKQALDAAGLQPVTPPKNLQAADNPDNPANTGEEGTPTPANPMKESA